MGCNYCFGCGADLAEDAKVCPSCGKRLDNLVNPPPLDVSETLRQPFKRTLPSPAKAQPAAKKPETAELRQKTTFIKVPPTKGAIIGYGLMLLNALTVEILFCKRARDSIMSPFADDDVIYIFILMLIILPLVVIPISKLKPRGIRSDQELVKKKTSVIQKITGLLYGLPALGFAVIFIYRELLDIKKYPESYSWYTLLMIATFAAAILSYAGLGIRQLFHKTAVQDKPPGQDEQAEQPAAAEKVSLEKEKRDT